MPNMKNIIIGHTKSVMNSEKAKVTQENKCNCTNKENCPLNGNCLAEGIVYRGNLGCEENESLKFKYLGVSEDKFKYRYNNHATSFRDPRYANKTKLSKKYWELKNQGLTPKVSWEIVKHLKKYENGQKCCNLCLTEKLLILKCRDKNLLDSRSEICSKCRHKGKFY